MKKILNHPVIDIFRSFSVKEKNEFKRFITSPYFNNSLKVKKLFNVLFSILEGEKANVLTKKTLWEKMNINQPYNDSTMRNLLADLLKLAKEFIFLSNINNKNVHKEIVFVKWLFTKNLQPLIETSLRNWQSNPSLKEGTAINNYVDIFEINLLLYKYLYLAKGKLKKDFLDEADEYLSKSQMYLLIFFLYRLIVAENDMITMANVFNHDINKSLIDKIFGLFNKDELKNLISTFSPEFKFFELYFHITDIFRCPSELERYKRFKEEFTKIKEDVPPVIRYDLLKFSIYYIDFNLLRNDTDTFLNREAFQLIKEIMDEKYFLFSDTKTLNHFMFINSCLRALRIGEFEWCKNFIQKNSSYLFPEIKDSVLNFAWSIFYYENGDLETSLNYYNKIKLENRLINIEYRFWGLKLFYDLGQFELLDYSIESFIKFLKSESFLEQSMESRYLNFAKCLKKLLDIKQSYSGEKGAMNLKDKIQKLSNVYDKDWILNRIE